jgi:hypothetical protein
MKVGESWTSAFKLKLRLYRKLNSEIKLKVFCKVKIKFLYESKRRKTEDMRV